MRLDWTISYSFCPLDSKEGAQSITLLFEGIGACCLQKRMGQSGRQDNKFPRISDDKIDICLFSSKCIYRCMDICTYIDSEISLNLKTIIFSIPSIPAHLCTYMHLLMSALVVKYLMNPQRFLLFYSFNNYLLSTCYMPWEWRWRDHLLSSKKHKGF